MQLPIRREAKTIIEKYGRKVELAYFREPGREGGEQLSEWLLFSSSSVPVIVFPLTDDGKVVAVEQFRYGANEVVLELPGGLIEKGEDWTTTAQREVLEETGYETSKDAKGGKLLVVGHNVWFDPCCYSERFVPVMATGCRKVGEPSAEHCRVVLCDLIQWYKACVTGGVADSKSLALSLMVLPRLNLKFSCLSQMTEALQ